MLLMPIAMPSPPVCHTCSGGSRGGRNTIRMRLTYPRMVRHAVISLRCACPCTTLDGAAFAHRFFVRSSQRLLAKLENIMDQPYGFNVQVTGILARLAHSPHPVVHYYLFPELALNSDAIALPWVCLIEALKKARDSFLCLVAQGRLTNRFLLLIDVQAWSNALVISRNIPDFQELVAQVSDVHGAEVYRAAGDRIKSTLTALGPDTVTSPPRGTHKHSPKFMS
jgi:Family of unknown function (DUF5917)